VKVKNSLKIGREQKAQNMIKADNKEFDQTKELERSRG
jgi:hypothetical protein